MTKKVEKHRRKLAIENIKQTYEQNGNNSYCKIISYKGYIYVIRQSPRSRCFYTYSMSPDDINKWFGNQDFGYATDWAGSSLGPNDSFAEYYSQKKFTYLRDLMKSLKKAIRKRHL